MKKKTLIAILAIVSFAVTGCNNGSTGGTTQQPKVNPPITPTPVEYTYSYPPVGTFPQLTLNFKPVGLPSEITYVLANEGGTAIAHTDGVVSGTFYGAFNGGTIKQIFSRGGKVVGSMEVKVSTNSSSNFGVLRDAADNQITQIPDVKLTY